MEKKEMNKRISLDVDFSAPKSGPETTFIDPNTKQQYVVTDIQLHAVTSVSTVTRERKTAAPQPLPKEQDGRRERHERFGAGSRSVLVNGGVVRLIIKKITRTSRSVLAQRKNPEGISKFYITGEAPSESVMKALLADFWQIPVASISIPKEDV